VDQDVNKKNGNFKKNVLLQSLEQLKDWLVSRGIDLSRWGCGQAKTVESLWDELVNGEMLIQDNPTLRIGHVVQIIIRRDQKILIESEQVFDDKRIRTRNYPPSEKMRKDETYREAAIRCLQEELGLDPEDIEIIDSTYRQTQKELESPSYPGLQTRYLFHIVEARVNGLPDTDFWTDESAQNQKDPIRRHHWTWRPQADGKPG